MQELQALTEAVGVVSRGLTADTIAKLPESIYIHPSSKATAQTLEGDGPVHRGCDNDEQCAICRMEFETGNKVKHLPCKHVFHPGCIDQWLGINKVSPNPVHLLHRRWNILCCQGNNRNKMEATACYLWHKSARPLSIDAHAILQAS